MESLSTKEDGSSGDLLEHIEHSKRRKKKELWYVRGILTGCSQGRVVSQDHQQQGWILRVNNLITTLLCLPFKFFLKLTSSFFYCHSVWMLVIITRLCDYNKWYDCFETVTSYWAITSPGSLRALLYLILTSPFLWWTNRGPEQLCTSEAHSPGQWQNQASTLVLETPKPCFDGCPLPILTWCFQHVTHPTGAWLAPWSWRQEMNLGIRKHRFIQTSSGSSPRLSESQFLHLWNYSSNNSLKGSL